MPNMPSGIVPNYGLGQNFLIDQSVLDAEIAAARLTPHDVVLEIGPGTGNLTKGLAAHAGQVVAIEQDSQFKSLLINMCDNVAIFWGDALLLPWPPFTKMVANLPYKVALPLIFKLLDQPFDMAVVIVQKDLAERLCARPGQPGYSRISVSTQRLVQIDLLQTVPAKAFWPAPSVESAIITLKPHARPFAVASPDAFRNLLDNLFLQRTVSVQAALSRVVPAHVLRQLPQKIRRQIVQQTTPEDFGLLSRLLDSHKLGLPSVDAVVKRTAQK